MWFEKDCQRQHFPGRIYLEILRLPECKMLLLKGELACFNNNDGIIVWCGVSTVDRKTIVVRVARLLLRSKSNKSMVSVSISLPHTDWKLSQEISCLKYNLDLQAWKPKGVAERKEKNLICTYINTRAQWHQFYFSDHLFL